MSAPRVEPAEVTDRTERPQPLLDLGGIAAGLRWRRRTWLGLALLGLVLGLANAVVLPAGPSAVTRIYVTHEEESPSNSTAVGETDVALFETTQVAAGALAALNITDERPEDLVRTYSVEAVAANILELTVSGRSGDDAIARAQALADAYIASHVGRVQGAADAEAAALTDRRDAAQAQLDGVSGDIADLAVQPVTPETASQLEALYAARAGFTGQIQDLSKRAEDASIGAPRVAAGTRIVDDPRLAGRSRMASAVLGGAVGLVLGLGIGFGFALISTVVSDRPVLRRDIAEALGASVVVQLPAPIRGPSRLWRRSRPVEERRRAAAVLSRTVRNAAGPVSLLELSCPRVAAALACDMAVHLDDVEVVVVDDLPRRDVLALGDAVPATVVDGADFPGSTAAADSCHIGVGTAGPGTAWTDLARLGAETLLVVRAGATPTARLHEVARQLADVGVHVIGIVLVHPDPRDRTDGTLWDGLHHALRGRAEVIARSAVRPEQLVLFPAAVHGNGTNGNGTNGNGTNGNGTNGNGTKQDSTGNGNSGSGSAATVDGDPHTGTDRAAGVTPGDPVEVT